MMMHKAMASTRTHAARSAQIALGIRSARALALVRHSQDHVGDLAKSDRFELESIRDTLTAAASALAAGRETVRVGGTRNLASVGLALSTAVDELPSDSNFAAAEHLRTVAADLDAVILGGSPGDAARLTAFLKALVKAATRSTAQQGETVVGVRS